MKTSKRRWAAWRAFLAGIAASFSGVSAWASDITWTNTSGDFKWNTSTPNNWSSNVAWSNGNVDSAIFNSAGVGTVVVAPSITVRGLQFNANGYLLQNGTLTLTNGGSGTLGVGEVQVASGVTATISSTVAGTVGLNKTGSGTLTLTGANTYTGGTTISAGVLSVSANNQLGSATEALTVNGGTLQITGTTFTSTNRAVNWTGGTWDVANAANTFTVNQSLSSAGALTKVGAGTLTLAGANTFTGFLSVNAGTLNVTGHSTGTNNVFIQSASMNITEGGRLDNASGIIGFNVGHTGTVTVGGGSVWNNSADMYVGIRGTGNLNISGGGAVANDQGFIGRFSGSIGTVTVSGAGSAWNTEGYLSVGTEGRGTLHVTGGGTVTNTGEAYIGDFPGSIGTVNIGGGLGTSTWTSGGSIYVGYEGNATLSINSGGIVSSSEGGIAAASISTSTVTVSGPGARWNTTSNFYVGYVGNGTLTITDGGTVTNGQDSYIGGIAGSVGTAHIGGGSGTSTLYSGRYTYVGINGTGTLTIYSGGTVTSIQAGVIGGTGGIGTVNVSGPTASWNATNLYVGYVGTATLNITDSGNVHTGGMSYVGFSSGSHGTVTVGGGSGTSSWTTNGGLFVGSVGSGTLNLNFGGTVTANALEGGNVSSSVKFNGGTLRIMSTDDASNTINMVGGGTIELPNAATDFILTGSMTGPGSLTKRGPGTLTLAGVGSSALNIEQGKVIVTGNYSASSFTFLNQGATLGGTGFLGGSVQGSGLFSPGENGTAVLTINGSMTMGNNSSFLVELQGTAPGSGHDQISLTGSYVLNNTALLMDCLGDYEAPFLSSFVIVRNSSGGLGGGQFVGLADGDLFDIDGQVFQIRYNVPNNYIIDPTGLQTGYAGITWAGDNGYGINGADNGGNIVIAAVPEPTSVMMLSAITLATVGYSGYRRNRGP